MTADEIRKWDVNCSGSVPEVNLQVALEEFKLLREIAAQLADLNQAFRSVIHTDEQGTGRFTPPMIRVNR